MLTFILKKKYQDNMGEQIADSSQAILRFEVVNFKYKRRRH